LEFFEREPEAIKDAKLKLYNCSRVTVYSLEDCTFVGKAILESRSAKKKLVKLKEYQIKDGEDGIS
jgi:hypothetical protein